MNCSEEEEREEEEGEKHGLIHKRELLLLSFYILSLLPSFLSP